MVWAGEIDHGFDGGVEKFGREYQRSGQNNDGPVTRGELQPQANDKNRCGNEAMNPRVALSPQGVVPSAKGVAKGLDSGQKKIFHSFSVS